MRSRSDDDLYAVENRYLGPPGRPVPWQARYRAYGAWVCWLLPLTVLRQTVGVLPGLLGWAVVGVLAVGGARLTMRVVGPERPAGAVVRMFLAELAAPRSREAPVRTFVADPRHVQVHLQVHPQVAARPVPGPPR